MADIIGFYSVAGSQGKRTISSTFAKLLVENNHKVLYVELDANRPSLTYSTQITHALRNTLAFFKNVAETGKYQLDKFVLSKDDLLEDTEDRGLAKLYKDLPDKLDYLVFPSDYKPTDFPTLISQDKEKEAQKIIQKLIFTLQESKYEYIIVNLPTELESMFGYEMIANSKYVVNVITANATRLHEYKEIRTFLDSNIKELDQKWHNVMNMTTQEIGDSEYQNLIKGSHDTVIVPFDPDRQANELSLKIGSEQIQFHLESLAVAVHASIMRSDYEGGKRKKFFGR
ncbi:AAA family ATPase [Terribacillus saccharophilus]|uniref:AAA family ATPase n=1 Tax=Terribacillus saccharophilus TaxID=361277 RepID=UPI002989C289|nr:AAA family ATPase [Terribacillus saccharophilus]MCM3227703.1 AAA family ATPase [Terribacillus saccharophilus]